MVMTSFVLYKNVKKGKPSQFIAIIKGKWWKRRVIDNVISLKYYLILCLVIFLLTFIVLMFVLSSSHVYLSSAR